MELLQLKKFCHAAGSGSFSATAREFCVPPSDISQSVRRLEQELGAPLFTRHANAVKLNERGAEFARRAQEALALLEDAAAAAADRVDAGQVHICAKQKKGCFSWKSANCHLGKLQPSSYCWLPPSYQQLCSDPFCLRRSSIRIRWKRWTGRRWTP